MKNIIVLCIILSMSLNATSIEWTDPSNGTIQYGYVYAPGMFASETQCAKYCPDFIASTGERVTCNTGINVIPGHVVTCNLSEVEPSSSASVETLSVLKKFAAVGSALALYEWSKIDYPSLKTFGLVSGFFYALWRPISFKVSHEANKKFGIQVHSAPGGSNFSIKQHAVNPFHINVAQDNDINLYTQRVKQQLDSMDNSKPKKIILYGVSRGSATVFESFAQLDARNESAPIAAVICEGIFDSIPKVVTNVSFAQKAKLNTLIYSGLTDFKKTGISPLASVDKIVSKDKPIALITSRVDAEVPFKNTLALYEKLKKAGIKHTHLLILNTSAHHEYPLGAEKERYRNFIHAFYRNYNLPYIQELAEQGEQDLNMSQP